MYRLLLITFSINCCFVAHAQNFLFNSDIQLGIAYGPAIGISGNTVKKQLFHNYGYPTNFYDLNGTTNCSMGNVTNISLSTNNRNLLRFNFDFNVSNRKQEFSQTVNKSNLTPGDTTFKIACSQRTIEFFAGIELILIETSKFSFNYGFGVGFFSVGNDHKIFAASPYESTRIDNYIVLTDRKFSFEGIGFNSGFNIQIHLNKRFSVFAKPQWIFLMDNGVGYNYPENQIRIMAGLGMRL